VATIIERDGRYQAKIRKSGFPSQSKTFTRLRDAEAWARKVESEMERGHWLDTKKGDKLTLGEALTTWEKEELPLLAPSSQATEKRRIKHLKEYSICNFALSKLKSADLAAFIKERRLGGASENTIRLDLANVSRVFNTAISSWEMEYLRNPVALLNKAKPKVPAGRERRLFEGEEDALLANASVPLQRVINFALATGMRRSEMSSLRWFRVNLKRSTLILSRPAKTTRKPGSDEMRTKNEEARTVPLSQAAVAALADAPDCTDRNALVLGMSPAAISQAYRKACDKAGIEGLTFHDLRHEATSRLFEDTDLTDVEIAMITGHKTMQMLKRYAHLRAHNLVARLAGGKRGASRAAPVEPADTKDNETAAEFLTSKDNALEDDLKQAAHVSLSRVNI
jgi:integrase